MTVTHDPSYYLHDGDTVFQVESTLFRVHRSFLARDKSTFQDMFSLDLMGHRDSEGRGEEVPIDGSCDHHPILLQGDTVDEFRALLSTLYALPAAIAGADRKVEGKGATKIIHLARITHKYNFITTEQWALQMLTSFLHHAPIPWKSDDPATGVLSADILADLTRIAVLCTDEQDPFFNLVMEKWRRIRSCKNYQATAISVAESLGLRDLRASAYYHMMVRGREAWELEPKLSREQRIILLSGHHALFKLCQDLLKSPPQFHSCGESSPCRRGWASSWGQLIGGLPGAAPYPENDSVYPLDLLEKLFVMDNMLLGVAEGISSFMGMSEACCDDGVTAIRELEKKIRSGLPDCFLSVV